jgi:hypothetical protein
MEMKKFLVIKRWEEEKEHLHGESGNEIGNICA